MNPTMSIPRLDQAIQNVLGAKVCEALATSYTGRVRMHDMACLTAFLMDLQTEDAAVLRIARLELSRTGCYPAAWWGRDETGQIIDLNDDFSPSGLAVRRGATAELLTE